MSKKSKRTARKRRVTTRVQAPAVQAPTAAAPTVQAAKQPAAPSPTTVDFSKEYRYVIADLKRIGILAAAMMGLLVVLSFIIR
ncbi:MAG: hypothetical protein NUW24_03555 [Anaerolineae bacterium]|jgi:hypothetical protein|nr:hypothetical protein [Anaerolineae bacterium]MDH7473571.1 hypothetical protein [Anaerolineae bacterium]